MIEPDSIKLLIAFALVIATAWVATAEGMKGIPRRARTRRAPRARSLSGAATAVGATVPAGSLAGAFRTRPRIFTGEPAPGEPAHPSGSRPARLAAGIAVLATAGAIGILAVARTLVAMFRSIGG